MVSREVSSTYPQLILVTTDATDDGVLFSSWHTFFPQRMQKGLLLAKFMQRIPGTPTQVLNARSHVTKIACTPTKTASTANIDLRCYVARQFFVANLRTFLAYNLQAKKCSGVQKNTNIRYEHTFASLASGYSQGIQPH